MIQACVINGMRWRRCEISETEGVGDGRELVGVGDAVDVFDAAVVDGECDEGHDLTVA
jgi:hypothetical protein